MSKKWHLQKGTRKMTKQVKARDLVEVDRVTIPPASEVNAAFMQVGEEIQQRHIEAFKRLAER